MKQLQKNNIIAELAQDKVVERIVENISHGIKLDTLNDLSQEIYVSLLEKDENVIQDLNKNNQMNYYITRMVINQYCSNNSPYHYLFRKYSNNAVETIEDYIKNEDEGY